MRWCPCGAVAGGREGFCARWQRWTRVACRVLELGVVHGIKGSRPFVAWTDGRDSVEATSDAPVGSKAASGQSEARWCFDTVLS
jgi:hypothetical protein